ALTQNDLKRVLAYSTLSQLGYMFLALGCAIGVKGGAKGEHSLVTFAVTAAIFHLFTHAFFKALLFLSAGSVMHAMGGIIDIRRFGGLRKVLPITHGCFLVGALALAGIIPFAGFWSKDEILAAALGASEHSDSYKAVYGALFFAALLTAALTAFYTFRAYFVTFWGELKLPPEAGQHAHADPHVASHAHGHGDAEPVPSGHEAAAAQGHITGSLPATSHGLPTSHITVAAHGHGPVAGAKLESPPLMTVPLIILAIFAAGIGLVVGPLTEMFASFLKTTEFFPPAAEHAMNPALMVGS